MQRGTLSGTGRSVVHIAIRTSDCEDEGVGVVLVRRPLTLLVPSHLLVLLEEDPSASVLVNGISCDDALIQPSPQLEKDYLSILQVRGRCPGGLVTISLPRRLPDLHNGQPISTCKPSTASESQGKILRIEERGDGATITTDLPVASGDSGSPLLAQGKLVGICQGKVKQDGTACAVAVPLSQGGLSELLRLRHRLRVTVFSRSVALLLATLLAFAGFAVYSSNSFDLASITVSDDGHALVALNAQKLTLHPRWSRTFNDQIRRAQVFSSRVGGTPDRIAIGTQYTNGINGTIYVLDEKGKLQWSYSVPDGECIYSTDSEAYDGYLVDVIHIADLDQDGSNDVLAVFVHNHHEPCKLVAFDGNGTILGEYWHPGYIRTIGSGPVGPDREMLVVLSASNNALANDWWNPQTIFAFRGTDIAGQGPPYDYLGAASRPDIPHDGSELWYKVILNPDPERIRAKCTEIDIRDFNGDGVNDIQAVLNDGRFYWLDEDGTTLSIKLGDFFRRDFPGVEPPPLVDVGSYLRQLREGNEGSDTSRI